MAIIKKDGNFMGLPMNIARGNPIPLDKSEIWYSYNEMTTYAATSPVAYVGQILGLVDEANSYAKAYIILNTKGDVQEVGKATVVDNSTIVLEEEKLSLKDFGKRYYRYVAESGNKEDGNYVAAHYELQEVDETHPWKAGLELKVVYENEKYAIGWYEPNPTTMEGVNSQIAGIQNTIDGLSVANTNLSNRLDNTYTKTQTNEEISKAVSAAAHLKRKEVLSTNDIDPYADGADQYIYMIPSGLTADDNKYYEYIVVEVEKELDDGTKTTEKQIERVGSWEVNLQDYATTQYVDNNNITLQNNISAVSSRIEEVAAVAELNVINSVSSSFSIDEKNDRQLKLVSIPAEISLSDNISLLNKFLTKDDAAKTYLTQEAFEALNIQANAERNIIASVSSEFGLNAERQLSLVSVSGEKIVDLNKNAVFSELSTRVNSLATDATGLESSINTINSTLVTINNKFNDYVTQTTHAQDMEAVWERLTWHEL